MGEQMRGVGPLGFSYLCSVVSISLFLPSRSLAKFVRRGIAFSGGALVFFLCLWATTSPHPPPITFPLGKAFVRSVPAPAWEGRQGAEAAVVSSGTTVQLSPRKMNCPWVSGIAEQAAHLPQFVEPALFIPNPMDGKPTHISTRHGGAFPPQKANTYVHPEVPTGTVVQPLWHTPHHNKRTVVTNVRDWAVDREAGFRG